MSVMSERASLLVERTNEYGHPQMYLVDDGCADLAVCAQCTACVAPNRGQGMICDQCDHEFTLHCEHDLY